MTQTKPTKNRISKKAGSFTESVIREMTREALKLGRTAKLSDGSKFMIICKSRLSIFIQDLAQDHFQIGFEMRVVDRRVATPGIFWFVLYNRYRFEKDVRPSRILTEILSK